MSSEQERRACLRWEGPGVSMFNIWFYSEQSTLVAQHEATKQ